MQKIIIITGKANSGKTQQAKALASVFKDEEVVFISQYNEQPQEDSFLFQFCKYHTKMVVIDEILTLKSLSKMIRRTWSGIYVNPRFISPFSIDPVLVFVCDESIKEENLIPDVFPSKIPGRVVIINCN